jgi:lysophospholipase L1-like esterase
MKLKTRVLALGFAILAITLTFAATYIEKPRQNVKLADLTRVACVGDSITELTKYPMDLQTMLGANSSVINFGASGSTVVFGSFRPYFFEEAFLRAKDFQPTTVVILLGTNDARGDVYPNIDTFVSNYEQIISQFQTLKSKPQIFLVKPPPIFSNVINMSSANLLQGVIPRVERVANEKRLPLIDIYAPLANHPEYFLDGVHPNDKGAKIIANQVYEAITSIQIP